MRTTLSYTACVVNGVKFIAMSRDANYKTQNSGVFIVSGLKAQLLSSCSTIHTWFLCSSNETGLTRVVERSD